MPAAIIRSGLKIFMQARISFPAMILVVEQMLKFIEGAFTTGLGQEAPARRE